jgi:hypothetical protein
VSRADEDLPLLSPEDEAELLAALEAALRPGELDPALNERLIEAALEDPLAPASDEELAESARLRDALDGRAEHGDAALLTALRAPFDAGASDDASVSRALESAFGAAPERKPRRNVIYVGFGAVSLALAAAAAAVLFVGTAKQSAPAASVAVASELAKPRSTAPLFDSRFETGDTTARMDLIASARSRDLRDNRYASWGVR